MHEKSIAYFWSRVKKTNTCWLWTGTTEVKGYGRPCINYRRTSSNKLAWLLAGGAIPDNMIVGHVCDNPPCVRNDDIGVYVVDGVEYERRGHLWLATIAANNADRFHKNRYGVGDRSPNHRLSERQVLEIIQRYAAGGISQRRLAAEYGVSEATVSHALSGRNWKHLHAR